MCVIVYVRQRHKEKDVGVSVDQCLETMRDETEAC